MEANSKVNKEEKGNDVYITLYNKMMSYLRYTFNLIHDICHIIGVFNKFM